MILSPQVRHPRSPWQAWLGPPQQGPVSPGPLELWLLAKASAAPATCWAHQSAFVSLVSHCIIHTKGPATRAPTAPLCPELAFPKLPNPPDVPPHSNPNLLSCSPQPPLLPTPRAEIPYTSTHRRTSTPHFLQASTNSAAAAANQQPGVAEAAARARWRPRSLPPAPPFITPKVRRSLPFLPSLHPCFASLYQSAHPGLGWERSPFSLFS